MYSACSRGFCGCYSIQVQKENHKNGLDISYTKYDFAGKVLETITKHETDVHELKIRYKYTYDHVGRPKEVKQKIYSSQQTGLADPNQNQEKIVSRYHYNELGQVTQKQLHSENEGVTFLQDVDFKYNVRGWLTHINDSELTDTRDVFGMELSYETGFEEVQHNGNISGVKWKSTTNNVERSYGFAYDKLGRLKRANFHAKDENTGAWTAENENYTVWDLNYDLDGNILSVKRNGLVKQDGQTKVFGLIDDLEYSYRRLDNRGKMLVGVEDRAEFETASKDFKDRNRGDDYEYNFEGSIISDKNKGVSFEYNHLGRVNKILNTANPMDKIDCLYDATGSKLQKIVKEGARTKKIDYVNGFQYRNDSLDFFPMLEGRVVFKDGEYILEYHFKDHLGNLRLAFQVTDRQNARYALTMEADSAKSEEEAFTNVKEARTDQKEQKGKYSARLTNADKAISKTIQVEKGDKISALVFATNDPEIAQTDPNKAIDKAKKDVLLSLGSAAAGVVTTNPTQQEIDIPLNPEISPAQTETIKSPKVRLNLLDFIPVIRNLRELNRAKRAKSLEPDSYYVPRGELVVQLRDSTDSLILEKREKITISATVAWEKLASDFTAEQDGNLTVFIDNQDTEPVYFDELELRVERTPTLVITQEHHYYPFGMNISGIERQGDLMYQFNGMVEKEQAFGLELYETPFRSYDAQLGRFWQVEPLADIYVGVSMYQFAYNNPVSFNDPSGLSPNFEEPAEEEESKLPTHIDLSTPIGLGDIFGNGSSGGGFLNPSGSPTIHIYANVFTEQEYQTVKQAKINLQITLAANGAGHIQVKLHRHSFIGFGQKLSMRDALIFVGSDVTTLESFSKIDLGFSKELKLNGFESSGGYVESASGYNLSLQKYPTTEYSYGPKITLQQGSRPSGHSMNTSVIMFNRIGEIYNNIEASYQSQYGSSDILTVIFLHVLGHNAGLPDNMSEGNIMGRYQADFGTTQTLSFFTPFNAGMSMAEITSRASNSLFYRTLSTYFYPSGGYIDNVMQNYNSYLAPLIAPYGVRFYNRIPFNNYPIFYFYDAKLFK